MSQIASEERGHVTGVDFSLNGGFTWDGCLGAATKNPLRRNARQLMLAPTNGMDAPTRNGIDVPKWKR